MESFQETHLITRGARRAWSRSSYQQERRPRPDSRRRAFPKKHNFAITKGNGRCAREETRPRAAVVPQAIVDLQVPQTPPSAPDRAASPRAKPVIANITQVRLEPPLGPARQKADLRARPPPPPPRPLNLATRPDSRHKLGGRPVVLGPRPRSAGSPTMRHIARTPLLAGRAGPRRCFFS